MCPLSLSLADTFLGAGKCIVKDKIFVAQSKTMETTSMHFKLDVGLVLILSLDHKHLVIVVTHDSILFDHVAQCHNGGYGILAKPDITFAAIHCGLVARHHGSAIALQSHSLACLGYIVDKLGIATKISIVDWLPSNMTFLRSSCPGSAWIELPYCASSM